MCNMDEVVHQAQYDADADGTLTQTLDTKHAIYKDKEEVKRKGITDQKWLSCPRMRHDRERLR
jgi:hypothetical protein